jgi:23S rRNA pseudouridine2605 synthase
MLERIEKILAAAGIASRRNAKELIAKGLVAVNGKIAKQGDKADPGKDLIEVNGKPVAKEKQVYVVMNKPRGVISAAKDARKTVVDIVNAKERIFPVGRLDRNAEGLIILTNDGDFANKVMHPRYNVKKTYHVVLDRALPREDVLKLQKGLFVEGRVVKIFDLQCKGSEAELAIHEGRKHIVKKIFELLGFRIASLQRIAIGNLRLELKPGQFKYVSKEWLEKNIF